MTMNYYYVKIRYACVRLRENENIYAKVIRGILIFLKMLFKKSKKKTLTPVSSCKRFCQEGHAGSKVTKTSTSSPGFLQHRPRTALQSYLLPSHRSLDDPWFVAFSHNPMASGLPGTDSRGPPEVSVKLQVGPWGPRNLPLHSSHPLSWKGYQQSSSVVQKPEWPATPTFPQVSHHATAEEMRDSYWG